MKNEITTGAERCRRGSLFFLSLLLVVSGCASGPDANPRDPIEPFNRGVYKFNDVLDRAVVKPVATAYQDVLPQPVRTGVNNFFNNLQDAWSFVNNSLQAKVEPAANSLMRFGVNSVFGLAGVLDVATEMRIERYTEDFGQTLGYWGVGAGPYLMLPLLGPSTMRDTAALPVDFQGNLINGVNDASARHFATGLSLLDRRSGLLSATNMLDQVALDPYTFTRDAFLQRRRSLVFDGNPPDEDDPDMSTDMSNQPIE